MNKEKQMSFLDHLEALRWHLVRSFVSIILCSIACFVFRDFILHKILLAPASSNFMTFRLLSDLSEFIGMGVVNVDHLDCIQDEKTRKLWEVLFAHIKISLYAGFVLSFPYVFWEIFRFIKPALHKHENKMANSLLFSASMLFFTGIIFGYYIISPISISFGISYAINSGITPDLIPFTDIIYNVTTIAFANGLLFELPILAYFLSKIGLITPDFMIKYRRHAIVLILILAAIITPPDVVSQILVALPVLFLYNISIKISKRVLKNQNKQ